MDKYLTIIVNMLAVYAVSTLLAEYNGFRDIFMKLRKKGLPDCAVCLSVWTAIPAALLTGLSVVEYLAVVGGVILLVRNL